MAKYREEFKARTDGKLEELRDRILELYNELVALEVLQEASENTRKFQIP